MKVILLAQLFPTWSHCSHYNKFPLYIERALKIFSGQTSTIYANEPSLVILLSCWDHSLCDFLRTDCIYHHATYMYEEGHNHQCRKVIKILPQHPYLLIICTIAHHQKYQYIFTIFLYTQSQCRYVILNTTQCYALHGFMT